MMSNAGLLLALTLCAPPDPPPAAAQPVLVEQWSPRVQQQIAVTAVRLMPDALARQLTRHSQDLRAGVLAPFATSDPEAHSLHADGRGGRLDQVIEQQVTKVVTLLNQRVPFRQVIYELGVTAHWAADTAAPLASSEADPREASYRRDLARFVETRMSRFPAVFYGYFPFQTETFIPSEYARQQAREANRFYAQLARYYHPEPDGPTLSSASFDDRHPVFGISQISFNHAVTAVANVWLHIWREARGDLAGTAYLEAEEVQK